jgi:hypothetical protein
MPVARSVIALLWSWTYLPPLFSQAGQSTLAGPWLTTPRNLLSRTVTAHVSLPVYTTAKFMSAERTFSNLLC